MAKVTPMLHGSLTRTQDKLNEMCLYIRSVLLIADQPFVLLLRNNYYNSLRSVALQHWHNPHPGGRPV